MRQADRYKQTGGCPRQSANLLVEGQRQTINKYKDVLARGREWRGGGWVGKSAFHRVTGPPSSKEARKQDFGLW